MLLSTAKENLYVALDSDINIWNSKITPTIIFHFRGS